MTYTSYAQSRDRYRVRRVSVRPEDFAGDTFVPARLVDCRAGDIIRLSGCLWQVLHTLGYVLVARELSTGEPLEVAR